MLTALLFAVPDGMRGVEGTWILCMECLTVYNRGRVVGVHVRIEVRCSLM